MESYWWLWVVCWWRLVVPVGCVCSVGEVNGAKMVLWFSPSARHIMTDAHVVRNAMENCVVVRTTSDSIIILWLPEGLNFCSPKYKITGLKLMGIGDNDNTV